MTQPQKDYDKSLDLHDSEWGKDGKKAPMFGPGAFWFFRVILPTIITGIVIAYGVSWFLVSVVGMPTGR